MRGAGGWLWWQVPRMLAVRYWRRRVGRLLLTVAGASAGVLLLLAVLLVNDALERTYLGWARGTVGWSDIEVSSAAQGGLSEGWLQAVRQLPGVGAVAPAIETRSYVFKGEAEASVTVRGVDPVAEEEMRPFSLSAGRGLAPGDAGVVMLSYAAALSLNAGPGSDVGLITPFGLETLRVVGVYHPSGAGTGSPRAALLPLPQAQRLFAYQRDRITRIDVAVQGAAVAEVEDDLRTLLASVATVKQSGSAWADLAAASAGLRAMLLLTGLLGVLAAGLLIFVHVRMMVAERSDDLRLLQHLGVPGGRVRRWLVTEVGVLVVLGAVPAVAAAAPLARAVLANLPGRALPFAATAEAPRLGSSVVSAQAAALLVAAVLLTLAARYLLMTLLGRVAQWAASTAGLTPWLRVGGHLLTRRHGQAGTVAAVLAFTMAGIVGVHGAAEANRTALTRWLDRTVTWDAIVATGSVTSGVSVALPSGTVERLAAVPGVQSVSAERRTEVPSRSGPITMIALTGFGQELGNRFQVLQAADLTGSAMLLRLQEGRGVAVSAPLAARLDLSVGDVLPLATTAGESDFTVVAVVHDAGGTADAAYIGLDEYSSLWGDEGVDSVALRLYPGAEAGSVLDAVSVAHLGTPHQVPLRVTLADAYRRELLAAAADSFRAARFMALLAFVVALVALVNCNLAAAWQAEGQLREFRAMGVSGRALLKVLVVELLLVGTVATTLGMVLGTLLVGRLSSSAALPVGTSWVWPLEAYASVGGLVLVAAGLLALLLAARQRVSLR